MALQGIPWRLRTPIEGFSFGSTVLVGVRRIWMCRRHVLGDTAVSFPRRRRVARVFGVLPMLPDDSFVTRRRPADSTPASCRLLADCASTARRHPAGRTPSRRRPADLPAPRRLLAGFVPTIRRLFAGSTAFRRRPADFSPASRRPISFSPTARRLFADSSPTLRRLLADFSPASRRLHFLLGRR